jgi:hypothetical protein
MLFLAARSDGALSENPAEFIEGVRRSTAKRRSVLPSEELRMDRLCAVLAAKSVSFESVRRRSASISAIYLG